MQFSNPGLRPGLPGRFAIFAIAFVAGACATSHVAAQDTPLISGGVGFFTVTQGGVTTYQPHIEPLIAAPVGKSFLIESRGIIFEQFAPKANGQPGYDHNHFADIIYLQGDYVATRHITVVAGDYILPFNTYNDRLSEIWIENIQDGPLIASISAPGTGDGIGGMLSGSAVSTSRCSVTYNAWLSSHTGNFYFNSKRSTGGRVSIYLPHSGVEVGASYERIMERQQENFVGGHLWWEPANTGFYLRSEYTRGGHAYGYWFETDYRMKAFGGEDSWLGRFEPAFRMQQTFRIDNLASDSAPSVNTQRADFGMDYNLPHNTRILTSYARQFTATGSVNVWETSLVYRFLFPAWKGKAD
jgi:hypothetical protein